MNSRTLDHLAADTPSRIRLAMQVSRRAASLKPSSTVAVMNRAAALKREGIDVLSFAAGEPDFDTPDIIKQAAIDALKHGDTKYSPTAGDAATRAVIADKLTRENGLPNVTPDHIIISSGGKQSLYLVFQSLLDAGDGPGDCNEFLLPVPGWVSFAPMAELAGGRVIELPTTTAGDFKITPDQLRRAITPRSRILLINSPSNPCGTMYSPAELRALADVVAEAAATIAPNLVIVSDELYDKIVFGSVPFFSIGSVPSVAERTITVNGLSKSYAMTGWRVGYAAGSGAFGKQVVGAMSKLQGQLNTCIASFVLPAIRVAMTRCQADVSSMRQAFAERGEHIYTQITRIPGLVCPKPTGAFYVFPDISAHFGKTTAGGKKLASAADFAAALLEEHRMAVVPGEDFGGCGPRHIRLSFACSTQQIDEGMKRLGAFVAGLK